MTTVVIEYATRRILRVQGLKPARNWLVTPGSTVKPFVLAALIQAGKLGPDEPYICPRNLSIAGRSFNCSHPPLSIPMTIASALAYSCNCYVAHFALRLQPSELSRTLARAGFHTGPARIELQSLGEAGVLVTPIDLAMAYHGLAAHAPQPVLAGLEQAVEYGTARLAAFEHEKIAGKTGTGRNHAWFAGFVPSRSPKFVISVLAAGKSGGADAAPIAGRILKDLCANSPSPC